MAKVKKKSVINYGSAKEKAAVTEQGGVSQSVKLPENMSWWSPPKAGGKVKLEFAPFRVGEGNPFCKAGGVWYERTYYVHRGIGVEEQTVVCRRRTFAKPCPVCDFLSAYKSKPNFAEKVAKELEPKQRQLFLVRDMAQPDKGWQLWDFSFHLFGKVLDNKLTLLDEDDPNNNFFHLEGGRQLQVMFKGKAFEGRSYCECVAIEFGKAREELDESILDDMPCLDDLLIDMGEKKLRKLMEQGGGDGDDEDGGDDTEPKKKGKPKDEDDDDGDGDEEVETDDDGDGDDDDDDSEVEPDAIVIGAKVKVKYKGKTVIGEVARVDEETERCGVKLPGVAKKEVFDFEDVTVVADDEEEPKKKSGKKPKDDEEEDELEFETEDEEEEEDDEEESDGEDEEEEEEEEEPKKSDKKPKGSKPKGSKPKGSKPKGRAFEEEAEEDDDLDAFDTEDEEEEERPKAKAGRKK